MYSYSFSIPSISSFLRDITMWNLTFQTPIYITQCYAAKCSDRSNITAVRFISKPLKPSPKPLILRKVSRQRRQRSQIDLSSKIGRLWISASPVRSTFLDQAENFAWMILVIALWRLRDIPVRAVSFSSVLFRHTWTRVQTRTRKLVRTRLRT